MSLVKDFGWYLVEQGIAGGSTGWELGHESLVQSPDQYIALYEPSSAVDTGTTMERRRFQVLVRSARWDADGGSSKANEIMQVLHRNGLNINETFYTGIIAIQSPGLIRVDELDRHIYSSNYKVLVNAQGG